MGLAFLLSGLAQYSGDPRIEWHLNTHSSKEAVIDAVKNLPYKGGNTLTGMLQNQSSVLITADRCFSSFLQIHVLGLDSKKQSFSALIYFSSVMF